MKTQHSFLLLLCAICLCACTPPKEARDSLTADELASLLGMYHWKIKELPDTAKPYWGVQVVVRNSDDSIIARSTALRFDKPVNDHGDCQMLLGLRRNCDGAEGTLIVRSSSTQFEFPHLFEPSHGFSATSGIGWQKDRAELLRIDSHGVKNQIAINLELLHGAPTL